MVNNLTNSDRYINLLIAKFTPEEQRAYQNSLKYYRDLNNVVETSRQEAIEEGIVIGREEGIKSLLLKQLSRKLGKIPDSIQQKINQLSMESLETLSEILFDLNTLEDLRDWLDNN